ncbi:hypothetical protein PACTADRAFT_46176 [Pachysolen tannophilus NRRL Y-2460]|uniref:MRH domain-containing protein n=1 Tax=Pachysolen tannophilus NRRL Y-2460 TaxID=669874 RepID=A0A1E4TPL3_PACTA|nr:hypothetical protein PACTADRAFT_46176 [Pachysolen tannophilus NRRL Y-2460]
MNRRSKESDSKLLLGVLTGSPLNNGKSEEQQEKNLTPKYDSKESNESNSNSNFLLADSDVIPPIKSPNLDPCTAINPLTNGFFDLRSLSSMNLNDGSVSAWNARGYDYNMNFTLGMCSSPLKKQNIQPGDFDQVTNTSLIGGFYTDQEGVKYSIGEYSTAPVFRGRKLTLTYTNGSFCEKTSTGEAWRKSTILSFTCDRELMAKAQISFVGVLHDCDYFFEVRTVHACPTAAKSDNLALVWIFLIIFLAALMVYCGAGTLYKKAILGRRGWRQLPSYSIVRNFKAAFGSNGSVSK